MLAALPNAKLVELLCGALAPNENVDGDLLLLSLTLVEAATSAVFGAPNASDDGFLSVGVVAAAEPNENDVFFASFAGAVDALAPNNDGTFFSSLPSVLGAANESFGAPPNENTG